MANKKEFDKPSVALVFTKAQIVKSEKYERFQDFLDGNLEDDKMYSLQEVDDLLGKYMKGMVK